MKTKKIYMTAALMIAALLLTGNAYAQGNDPIGQDKARNAIEKTDEVIASAAEIVNDTRSQKARTSLTYSKQIQNRAKTNAGISNNSAAYKLTMQSRTEAWHAINLARTSARQEEMTKRLIEHTTEKLIMLRSRIAESGVRDERVMRLMNESRGLMEKSKVNHQERRRPTILSIRSYHSPAWS